MTGFLILSKYKDNGNVYRVGICMDEESAKFITHKRNKWHPESESWYEELPIYD